jgi:hypothetical protein
MEKINRLSLFASCWRALGLSWSLEALNGVIKIKFFLNEKMQIISNTGYFVKRPGFERAITGTGIKVAILYYLT